MQVDTRSETFPFLASEFTSRDKRIADLIAERDRLKTAIQEIIDFEPIHPCIRSPYEQIAAFAKNTARLALAEKETA